MNRAQSIDERYASHQSSETPAATFASQGSVVICQQVGGTEDGVEPQGPRSASVQCMGGMLPPWPTLRGFDAFVELRLSLKQ